MANEVKLPRLGQGMEAGTVNKWLKAEGEPVKEMQDATVAHRLRSRPRAQAA